MKHFSMAAGVAAATGAGAWRWMALFLLTFCITLFFEMRATGSAGSPLLPAIPLVASSKAPDTPESPPAAAATSRVVETAEPSAMPVAQAEDPARYAAFIDSALTDDDSQARGVAIRELAQAPAEQAIATLEQVLRTDSDPENRALAVQELLRMPAGDEVRPARAQLLQEFADDADGRVAALAREGLQRAPFAN